jgi:hypothetical protein
MSDSEVGHSTGESREDTAVSTGLLGLEDDSFVRGSIINSPESLKPWKRSSSGVDDPSAGHGGPGNPVASSTSAKTSYHLHKFSDGSRTDNLVEIVNSVNSFMSMEREAILQPRQMSLLAGMLLQVVTTQGLYRQMLLLGPSDAQSMVDALQYVCRAI